MLATAMDLVMTQLRGVGLCWVVLLLQHVSMVVLMYGSGGDSQGSGVLVWGWWTVVKL